VGWQFVHLAQSVAVHTNIAVEKNLRDAASALSSKYSKAITRDHIFPQPAEL